MLERTPSIMVLKSVGLKESEFVKKVFQGIEEEGIPYEVQYDNESSAIKLAYKAALNSRLNVGIGIGPDYSIALHYSQLDEDAPLFMINGGLERGNSSNFGINAARLVKGLPFKEI